MLLSGAMFAFGGSARAIFGTGGDRIIGLAAAVFFGGGTAAALLLDRPVRVGSPVVLQPIEFRGAVSDAFVFPRPARNLLLALLGALIFVAFGVTFIVFAPRFGSPPIVAVVGAVTILCFGYMGLAAGLGWIRGRAAGLFLLRQGMGWVGGGFAYLVPWDAVASVGLRMVRFGLSPAVCLSVHDRGSLQAGPILKGSMLLSRWIFGADMVLQNAIVRVPVERLIPIIERYRTRPEFRDEIGTPAGLAVVKQFL